MAGKADSDAPPDDASVGGPTPLRDDAVTLSPAADPIGLRPDDDLDDRPERPGTAGEGVPDLGTPLASPEEAPRLVLPDPLPPPLPPSPTPPPPRRSALPLVLGGVTAAALGFGAAWAARTPDADLVERLAALEARPETAAATEIPAALEERLSAAEARLAGLEEALAATPAEMATDPDAAPQAGGPEIDLVMGPDIGPVEEAVAALDARAAALEERLATLESRPPALPAEGGEVQQPAPPAAESVAALEARLAEAEAALAALDGRVGKAEATSAEAAAAAEAAAGEVAEVESRAAALAAEAQTREALAQVAAALDTGEPFAAPLAALDPAGAEPLAALAEEGAPTLAELQASFPAAARAALAMARDEGLEEGSGVGAFLRRQFGVRSVEPRAGDSPDAVLSRAEAALRQGDLDGALAEAAALPEPVRAVMQGWIAQVTARAEAERRWRP